MGKLCNLMGLAIWNTRYTGWQSGNYSVTTVCCFPCNGKAPCILATFDYSGLELSHIVLFFPSSFFLLKFITYNIFLFIPESSHNLNTIIWHLSWLTLVSQLTYRVAVPSTSKSSAGKIQYQARCMEIEGTKAGLNLNYFNWTSSIQ
jgi:hypothetical protein